MKLLVIKPYPGPNGTVAVGSVVDEHPLTAERLLRLGFCQRYETKPKPQYEVKRPGAGNPVLGHGFAEEASKPPPAGAQLPDAAPSDEGERQAQQEPPGSSPEPAVQPQKKKRGAPFGNRNRKKK